MCSKSAERKSENPQEEHAKINRMIFIKGFDWNKNIQVETQRNSKPASGEIRTGNVGTEAKNELLNR